MLTPIINAFHSLLNFLGSALAVFYQVIPNYGVAIILLTIATRLVLLPLTIKQTRSMQEMQRVQPELKKLQAKYKGGDKAKLNEEMMKLYKEHHVNPLGGCLPLLLQLPIFLALYRVLDACGKTKAGSKACLPNYVGLGHLPKGSALYSALLHGHNGFLGINLGLSPVRILHGGLVQALPSFVLVFLMVATTWYQQKQIMGVSSGQQADQMKIMGQIMPLLLGVFSLELAAGISVYWVASNIWTVGQQAIVLKKPAAGVPPGGADGGKKPAAAGSKGGGPKATAGPAGNGKPTAAAAKAGAREPQSAGTGGKPTARTTNGGKATAAKGGAPAKSTGTNGAGKTGAGGGSGQGGQGPKATQRPGGGKPGAKPVQKPSGTGVTRKERTPAEPAVRDGATGSDGGTVADPPGELEVELEVGVPDTPPVNGKGANPGLGENDTGAEPAAKSASGNGPATRPRPQRAQPGASSGGRKRRG